MAKSSKKKAKSSGKSVKKASKSAKPAKKSSKPVKKAAKKKAVKPAPKKAVKKVAKKVVKKIAKHVKPANHSPLKKPVASVNSVAHSGKHVVKPIVTHTASSKRSKEMMLKTRYSDKELEEFRQLILEKLEAAKNELKYLQDQISHKGDNNTSDTENTFASSDDGSNSMEREYLTQMAARQRLYIDHLDKALVRIKNKTYGICRVTGKLIEKERLRAVPHATLSMEAKLLQQHPQAQNV
ncbi:MAG: TraR/DksA family transcriptional regulator [Chitinophagales bacterium]